MITAIADDFTGAAELGGIGLRYGLDVTICTSVPDFTLTDLLVLATDTRSMQAGDAAEKLSEILTQLNTVCLKHFFKKTDSALRGHVLAELEVVQKHFHEKKVLLVPCNPSLDRTISNGIYYVEGQPIHKTSFAHEYEHEPENSDVLELLNTGRPDISVLRPDQLFTSRRFVIGEAHTVEQVEDWAEFGIIGKRVLAGGADFFSAFLKKKGFRIRKKEEMAWPVGQKFGERSAKSLFICGSTSDTSRQNIERALKQGKAVCSMPGELFRNPQINSQFIDKWRDEIIRSLESHQRVIVAVNKPLISDAGVAEKLRHCMAKVTASVLNRTDIRELFIEGGATAAAIIQRLELKRFLPVQELSAGVLRMHVAGEQQLTITLKPGSYKWPENLWNIN